MKTVKFPIDIFSIAWWVHNLNNVPTKTRIIVDGYNVRVNEDMEYILIVLFHTVKDNARYKFKWHDVSIYSSESAALQKVRQVKLRRNRLQPYEREYKDEWE